MEKTPETNAKSIPCVGSFLCSTVLTRLVRPIAIGRWEARLRVPARLSKNPTDDSNVGNRAVRPPPSVSLSPPRLPAESLPVAAHRRCRFVRRRDKSTGGFCAASPRQLPRVHFDGDARRYRPNLKEVAGVGRRATAEGGDVRRALLLPLSSELLPLGNRGSTVFAQVSDAGNPRTFRMRPASSTSDSALVSLILVRLGCGGRC